MVIRTDGRSSRSPHVQMPFIRPPQWSAGGQRRRRDGKTGKAFSSMQVHTLLCCPHCLDWRDYSWPCMLPCLALHRLDCLWASLCCPGQAGQNSLSACKASREWICICLPIDNTVQANMCFFFGRKYSTVHCKNSHSKHNFFLQSWWFSR